MYVYCTVDSYLLKLKTPYVRKMCLYTQKNTYCVYPKNQCFASTVNEIFDIYKDL